MHTKGWSIFAHVFSNLHKMQIKVGGGVEKYLPRGFGVENIHNNFDLDPMALALTLAIFTLTLMTLTLDHK